MIDKSFEFELPQERIAQFPAATREASRLLVCDRKTRAWEHSSFSEIGKNLQAGDLLVLNDTKVIPARLFATLPSKKNKQVEIFLLRDLGERQWECLAKPAKLLPVDTTLQLGDGAFEGTVCEVKGEGMRVIEFKPLNDLSFSQFLNQYGKVPLPPYIKREDDSLDKERYQTIYAQKEGAVAAPTAGLHFTSELLTQLEQNKIETTFVTLHVGLGTFRPLSEKQWKEGKLHNEAYAISTEAADKINKALEEKRRIIAVGTTTVRALESAAKTSLPIQPTQEETDIFIYPPFDFKVVSGMITNFHLPNSSLLWLVSAFAKKEFIQELYQEAIRKEYRFYSYGDAMLIL